MLGKRRAGWAKMPTLTARPVVHSAYDLSGAADLTLSVAT